MIETAEKLNNQAIILAADGNFNDAIACFTRAITIEKDNYLLWYNLGITYRDSGNFKKAKHALIKAYDISNNDEDVIEALSLICFNLSEYENAIEYCSLGLDKNPQNPHLWNTLGVVLFNQAEYNGAVHAFEQAVTLSPYYYDALYNLKDSYAKTGNILGKEECENKLKSIRQSK